MYIKINTEDHSETKQSKKEKIGKTTAKREMKLSIVYFYFQGKNKK